MNEIYWITRLDTIQGFCIAILVIGVACIFISILRTVTSTKDITEPSVTNKFKWVGIALTVIFIPLVMFIPNSKDAMLIFGIGPTIDYIQNNETAKQLPDKCINALNDWVESLSDPKNDWADGQTEGEQ
jgi:hypothetical protein